MTRRTPELLLEQLRRGELSPERAEALRARLAEEPGGLERLAALDASDAEILERYPPRVVGAALRQRLKRRRQLGGLGALGLALAAGLALLTLRPDAPTVAELPVVEEDGVRLKGLDPRLQLHRLSGEGAVEALADGDRARAGDRLQLGYVAAGEAYGAVLSVDGRGVVTRHLPRRGDLAAALEGGGAHALPDSYELDDAPEFERFFLVVGPAPFDLSPVLEAAEGLPADAPLPLDDALSAASLTLVKE